MLMIVAHHFVVHSGLSSIIKDDPTNVHNLFLSLFGMWGKTGIDCFVMITGYFMCQSTITLRKFVKLLFQIYLYKVFIFTIFAIAGYETISLGRMVTLCMPIWGIGGNFIDCFLVFWLTIPFWNILIHHLTQKQHGYLLMLLVGVYTILGSIPKFGLNFNHITWYGIIFLIASYIRLYPCPLFERRNLWALMTVISAFIAMVSVYVIVNYSNRETLGWFFVSDANKILAIVVAVCSFLWFKNIRLSYNKWINIIGASTFGVLLIHDASGAMRTWLWKDTLHCAEHYSMPTSSLIPYSLATVLLVFTVCILIDRLRILLIERPFFKWFDKLS